MASTSKEARIYGLFLIVVKGTVNLIHQSAKDYLDENYKFRLQLARPAQGYSEIVRRSTDTMSLILRYNIYNLDLGFKPENITPSDLDPLAPIHHWVNIDTATGVYRQTFKGHYKSVSIVVFSPDGKTLDIATGVHQQTLEGYSDSITIVIFSLDSKTLISPSDDKTVRLWDTATGV
ncbi:hypothetical protein C8A01DRAFT_51395 [Parachaetomium inaequale]|uniref:Mitochondrial division protein 1 n=1 Tax=Parachaetomium inaequale TaxID=2588326 RepID=A0AAN6P4L0_9PEZI|nr:hypothetical protein C8A01DRAFT_51395 [Parachaetomium inaequale]